MKPFYFGLVLVGFACVALSTDTRFIYGNKQDHGWDGLITIDRKTGLLRPPVSILNSREEMDYLTFWGPHANKYCKVLDLRPSDDPSYHFNFCTKDGRDICCFGRQCTSYGEGGGYCKKLGNNDK